MEGAKLHGPPDGPRAVLRVMHALGGEAGWGDEVVLGGIVVILGAFLLWGWWKQRHP